MNYRVIVSRKAQKQLERLDAPIRKMILSWMRANLEGTDNPRLAGKILTGNLSGYWRYRVGNYRIVVKIQDEILLIVVVALGHRKDIYSII